MKPGSVVLASAALVVLVAGLASTAHADSNASRSCAPITQREGRHSRRQGADALDQRVECGIGGDFMAEEPAPEPIVLAIQQP